MKFGIKIGVSRRNHSIIYSPINDSLDFHVPNEVFQTSKFLSAIFSVSLLWSTRGFLEII